MGKEPLGLEHFLGQGGHYPHEILLDALIVGKLFFQWWCHLPPSGFLWWRSVLPCGATPSKPTISVHLSAACSRHCVSLKCPHSFFYFFFLIYFIYLFLAALGLRCCARAFSSCSERGLLLVPVHGLLIAVTSLCWGARALGAWASVVAACGLSSFGSWALEHRLSSCSTRA